MTTTLTLQVELLSEWHIGSGTGTGPGVDLAVHCDPRGLPCLPGRTLRGLLRDAWWERAEWLEDASFARTGIVLFGEHTRQRPGKDCSGGCLDVRDALLAPEVAGWLVAGGSARIGRLLRTRKATAIDAESGAAKSRSLRTMEVAVPVTLFAPLTLLTPLVPESLDTHWADKLAETLRLIRGLGIRRSRGLGRCRLSVAAKEVSP